MPEALQQLPTAPQMEERPVFGRRPLSQTASATSASGFLPQPVVLNRVFLTVASRNRDGFSKLCPDGA